jgi:lipoprotein-anchoring transpeptidase ErfK/SrfK
MFPLRLSATGWRRLIILLLAAATPMVAQTTDDSAAQPVSEAPAQPAAEEWPRNVNNWLEAQIALARLGFSSGAIDGVGGAQSSSALSAFQSRAGLRVTGQLDEPTRAKLQLTVAPFTEIEFSIEVLAQLQPLSPTWLGKSAQTLLTYESALEWAAECTHASPALIRQLNPAIDWANVLPGARFTVPAVGHVTFGAKAAQLRVGLAAHTLEAFDDTGRILAHFPVSIARLVEKRPEGVLYVTVVIADPDYTFDPAIFPESEEGRELGRRVRVPPGPNNPVGVAWIGLDRPGYGIHGTPSPEKVGRTESHGCFRLANWDALTLLDLAWVGLPVVVDP